LVPIERILEIIQGCSDSSLGLPISVVEKAQKMKERIHLEINQIESGERESDARLAAAIDSLTPTLDYHQYSSN